MHIQYFHPATGNPKNILWQTSFRPKSLECSLGVATLPKGPALVNLLTVYSYTRVLVCSGVARIGKSLQSDWSRLVCVAYSLCGYLQHQNLAMLERIVCYPTG